MGRIGPMRPMRLRGVEPFDGHVPLPYYGFQFFRTFFVFVVFTRQKNKIISANNKMHWTGLQRAVILAFCP